MIGSAWNRRQAASTATNPRLWWWPGLTRYSTSSGSTEQQNIELVRYSDFGGELLALELLTSVSKIAHLNTEAHGTSSPMTGRTDRHGIPCKGNLSRSDMLRGFDAEAYGFGTTSEDDP